MYINTNYFNQSLSIQDNNSLSGQMPANTIKNIPKNTPILSRFKSDKSLDETMYRYRYICTSRGTCVPVRVQSILSQVHSVLLSFFSVPVAVVKYIVLRR